MRFQRRLEKRPKNSSVAEGRTEKAWRNILPPSRVEPQIRTARYARLLLGQGQSGEVVQPNFQPSHHQQTDASYERKIEPLFRGHRSHRESSQRRTPHETGMVRKLSNIRTHKLRFEICCLFKNLAFNYLCRISLHSADKLSNEQQILDHDKFIGSQNVFRYIIILIMIEVAFEMIHFADRYAFQEPAESSPENNES